MHVSDSKPVQVLTPENSTSVKNLMIPKAGEGWRDLTGSLRYTQGKVYVQFVPF